MIGIDAQFNLISYAVLSTKFESDKNVVLSFLPLIEHVLLNIHEDVVKTTEIIDSFEEMFGYKLPYAIISELLIVLFKKGKVVKLKNESLEINKETLVDYDLKEQYELRLRALVSDFDIFAKKKGVTYNRADIINLTLRFIVANVIEFNSFISYKSNFESIVQSEIQIQEDLIEFLVEERKNNTENYTFLQDIYYGVVIASLITNINEKDIDEVEQYTNSYNIENVLLDSNFVFRLLDLQTELEHKVATDTYNMLRNKGCKFWICNETLKQIADTLRHFSDQYSESANKVLRTYGDDRFTGLAAACLRRDLTPSKIEVIIGKLVQDIHKLDISVFDEFEINEEDIDVEERDSLYKLKPDTSEHGIFHDLMLIYIVRKKRPTSIYQMKQAKWWVLTDDNRLTKWNCNYSPKNNIQECMTESQIATVMWLNEPKQIGADSFFTTVLALRNRNLVNNDEYAKISKIIEMQKNKYEHDENAMEKLSLVFSKQMLRIDDFLDEEENKLNDILSEKMEEASAQIAELNDLRQKTTELENDRDQTAIAHKEELAVAEKETEYVKSVLSKEILENIKLLKERFADKERDISAFKDKKEKLEKKQKNQESVCKFIVAIAYIAVLLLIKKYFVSFAESWYSQHEFWYEVICYGAIGLLGIFGIKASNVFKVIIKWTNFCLIKIRIQKDYQNEIRKIDEEIRKLTEDSNAIIDQIEEKSKIS